MDEPIVCYVALILIGCWAAFSVRQKSQECLIKAFSQVRCFGLLRLFQWYNLTTIFLGLSLFRTLYDVIRFDFVASDFLSPEAISQDHGFCVGVPREYFDNHMVGIPLFLRRISLASPIAGLLAFFLVVYNVRIFIKSRVPSQVEHCWQTMDGEVMQHYIKWIICQETTMVMVVIGMPLVFVVMALRATIRQWAVMTCSSWPNLHYQFPALTFADVRILEVATYTQDLSVACAFQFIAVFYFGKCCSHALQNREAHQRCVGIDEQGARCTNIMMDDSKFCRMCGTKRPAQGAAVPEVEGVEQDAEGIEGAATQARNDRIYKKRASILGIYAFTFIGLIKSLVSIAVAMCEDRPELQEAVSKIQVVMVTKVDPCFLFATVLSVINMFFMGKIKDVKDMLGNVNLKFNATRILLLIGQGQLQALTWFATTVTTKNPSYAKIKAFLDKVGWNKLSWAFSHSEEFNEDQARLLHSSLLCFECLLVALVNLYLWQREFEVYEKKKYRKESRTPLLGAEF